MSLRSTLKILHTVLQFSCSPSLLHSVLWLSNYKTSSFKSRCLKLVNISHISPICCFVTKQEILLSLINSRTSLTIGRCDISSLRSPSNLSKTRIIPFLKSKLAVTQCVREHSRGTVNKSLRCSDVVPQTLQERACLLWPLFFKMTACHYCYHHWTVLIDWDPPPFFGFLSRICQIF